MDNKRVAEYVAESCTRIVENEPKPVLNPKDMVREFYKLVPPGAELEHFVAVYLNSHNVPILAEIISIGTIDQCFSHPRDVFCPAVRARAACLVVAHNHPSGDPTPSPEDIVITKRLREAGQLLDIELIDHVVLGKDSWVSIRSEDQKQELTSMLETLRPKRKLVGK